MPDQKHSFAVPTTGLPLPAPLVPGGPAMGTNSADGSADGLGTHPCPNVSQRRPVPPTVLSAKTVVAACTLALAATGTAVAFATPTSLPDQASARVAAAQAHRAEHAGAASASGSTTATTTSATSTTVPPAPTPSQAGDEHSGKGSPGTGQSHASQSTHATTHPATPSAAGEHTLSASAAFGLCTAFNAGGLASGSTAYGYLAKAAGGAGHVVAYCATIAHPGTPSGPPTSQPTVKPSAVPPTH
jgi:hypothetical protein